MTRTTRMVFLIITLASLAAIMGIVIFTGDDDKPTGPQVHELRAAVTMHLRGHLRNPDSYESVSWSNMRFATDSGDTLYYIDHTYRARNAFNGVVTEDIRFVGQYNDGGFTVVAAGR